MTKAELIDTVQDKSMQSSSKKDVGLAVQGVFDALAWALVHDGRISYPGFGTFKVKERKAREGRNPRTGAALQIPASRTVNFKVAPSLKEML